MILKNVLLLMPIIFNLTLVQAKVGNYDEFPKIDGGFVALAKDKIGLLVRPNDVIERVKKATSALQSSTENLEGSAIKYFIKKSDCIAWINLYRASLIGGMRLGRGMATCQIEGKVKTWSAPFYIQMGELSAGAQLGADQSDYFLFFPDKSTFLNVLKGNVKMSGNTALTVAKWGRSASIGTDVDVMEMEIKKDVIYSYAVSRGAYAGVTLDGGLIIANESYNHTAYHLNEIEKIINLSYKKAPLETRSFSMILDNITKAEIKN